MLDQLVSWWIRRSVTVPEGWVDVRERPSPQVNKATVGWYRLSEDDALMGAIFYHPGEERPWAAACIINGTPVMDDHYYNPALPFSVIDGLAKQWDGLMDQPYMKALLGFDWSSPAPGEVEVVEVNVCGYCGVPTDQPHDMACPLFAGETVIYPQQPYLMPDDRDPDEVAREQAALRHWEGRS